MDRGAGSGWATGVWGWDEGSCEEIVTLIALSKPHFEPAEETEKLELHGLPSSRPKIQKGDGDRKGNFEYTKKSSYYGVEHLPVRIDECYRAER